jgi:phosphoribosylformylglycinamidine cyclo-ligase
VTDADKRVDQSVDKPGLTYAGAGVDIEAGEKAVSRIGELVRSTYRPEVLGDIGGFGGLFAVDWKRYRDPLLVSSTDGVGTKSWIARQVGRLDTIGIDLVAMSADDVAVQGAEPLFFLDYISTGRVDPDEMELLVGGVARGCAEVGCALLGGEMSEHPGIMQPDDFDLVGFCVGVVDRGELLPRDVVPGDAIVGIASPGLRCNGYSLARRALLEHAGRRLDEPAWPGHEHTLGEELLVPSVLYTKAMLGVRRDVPLHAFAHITGGGIPGNLDRVLPNDCDAVVRRGSWPEPRIFAEVQRAGGVSDDEMEHVFNLGVGMAVVVAAGHERDCVEALASHGHDAFVIGSIEPGHQHVHVIRR